MELCSLSEILPLTMIIIVLGIAVAYDLKYRRIPNWLTFPAMAVGMAYHIYTCGVLGLVLSMFGLILGFSVFMVFYVLGGMGAGDVKLVAAIGAFLGPVDILFVALYTSIAGGVYAALLIIFRKGSRKGLLRFYFMVKNLLWTGHFVYVPQTGGEKAAPLRYGIAIATGTLMLLAQRIMK